MNRYRAPGDPVPRYVYLSGPMHGAANYDHFHEAEQRARALGWIPISPARLDEAKPYLGDKEYPHPEVARFYANRDSDQILQLEGERGDAIAMLPGWEGSLGAPAEKALAEWVGLQVLDARDFTPLQQIRAARRSEDTVIVLPGIAPVLNRMEKPTPFSRTRLLALHEALSNKGRELMERKNQDYGANEDPFRNFHQFGLLGILVRLSDKLARLQTYTERGTLMVKDESVVDTVLDLINYAVLFEGYRQAQEEKSRREAA